MEKNIYELNILGKIEVDQPIDTNKEYSVYLERVQNDEGKTSSRIDKFDRKVICWKMRNLDIAILKEGNNVIKGKPKGSRSQAFRMAVRSKWEEQHSGDIDEETFYNKIMDKCFELLD